MHNIKETPIKILLQALIVTILIAFSCYPASAVTVSIDSRAFPAVQYVTPVNAATVSVNSGGNTLVEIDPAGTLATLTVTMPSSPTDGDKVNMASTQIVTALTLNGGTLVGALTAMTVGGFATYVYSSTASKWIRMA